MVSSPTAASPDPPVASGGVTCRPLVLASASPARLRLLRDAGFDPTVMVSGVDEQTVTAADPRELVGELARRKAAAVATGLRDALVVGADSMLLLDGQTLGKPHDAADARARWLRMRGRTGTLLTGQAVIDVASGRTASGVAATTVRFGTPTDEEVDAYVACGEPLAVAGAFTLDGRSAPFVEGITGDAGTVIGLSLPLLRTQLADLGVRIHDLWAACP